MGIVYILIIFNNQKCVFYRMPNLIPPADWKDAIPKNEARPDMIDTPRGSIGWDYYLTGKEGFVGRDNIESGGMYFPDGRPLIQTADLVTTGWDLIHHKELKQINDFFASKKFQNHVSLLAYKSTSTVKMTNLNF